MIFFGWSGIGSGGNNRDARSDWPIHYYSGLIAAEIVGQSYNVILSVYIFSLLVYAIGHCLTGKRLTNLETQILTAQGLFSCLHSQL